MSTPEDTVFGQEAVSRGYVTNVQLEECTKAMALVTQAGLKRSLGDIMVEKGLLTDVQAEGIRRSVESPESKIIAGFELLDKLGEGGMGAVYKARQLSMDRTVALKILPDRLAKDQEFIARFMREARIAAKLDHVNIVRGIDVGREGDNYFFAMEFVEGESIGDLLRREGSMSEEQTLHIAIQIVRALDHAWERNLIHRDIKPDNIMLTKDGVGKLADLGLARSTAGDSTVMTRTGVAIGTPHYMSPEQARGQKDLDIRTDIYSLGATLYHMLVGETPFSGSTAAVVLTKHLNEMPEPACRRNPKASERTSSVIARMMAKDPDHRYANPKELLTDLELVADSKDPVHSMKMVVAGGTALAAEEPAASMSLMGMDDVGPTDIGVAQATRPRTSSAPGRPGWLVPVVALGGLAIVGVVVWAALGGRAEPKGDGAPASQVASEGSREEREKAAKDEAKLQAALEAAAAAEKENDLKSAIQHLEIVFAQREDAAVGQRLEMLKGLHRTELLAEQAAALERAGELEKARLKYLEAQNLARGDKHEDLALGLAEVEKRIEIDRIVAEIRREADAARWREVWKLAEDARKKGIADGRIDEFARAALSKLAPARELTGPLGVRLVLIPGGVFKMGSDSGRENERPVRDVMVSAFYLGRHEVTVAQYEAFRQGRSSALRGADRAGRMPAVSVTWQEALEFCKHLTSVSSADRPGVAFRLPTEAEWEFAARGAAGREYPWGDEAPTPGRANLAGPEDGFDGTAPVGSFPDGATPLGLTDMAGNVFQWCSDRYGAYPAGPQTDPGGPVRGAMRVIRGGAYEFDAILARGSGRGGRRPDQPAEFIGFRVVRELTPDEREFLKFSGRVKHE